VLDERDLSPVLPGRGSAAGEDSDAGPMPCARAAAPVASDETVVGGGLRLSRVKPGVAATAANTIPKTQPGDFRVFI
jgi:hypothetical protein